LLLCVSYQTKHKNKKGPKIVTLRSNISSHWNSIQYTLFPFLEDQLEAPFTPKLMQLITILEIVRIENFLPYTRGSVGRPSKNRSAIARAFIAKTVLNIPATNLLIDRLQSDKNLRRICGFEFRSSIPSESAFSRAFKEFAELKIPQRAHEAVVKYYYQDQIVGHISKDSTAIEAREKPVKKKKEKKVKKEKRASKGSVEKTRIQKQIMGTMTLEQMIKDLPSECDIGRKTSSSGHMYAWIGFKLHLAVDDNSVPLAAIISSASMNDTQAAIPLAEMTSKRVTNLYDLMDSGYHAEAILEHSKSLGHVPIIDRSAKSRAQKVEKEREKLARKNLNWIPAEKIRYKVRTSVERANARLKDEFGALSVRVRGTVKVFAHLMFGVLAQTADQLLKLIT
jgi:transposase